jgi:hypothetical protein
MPVARGMIDAPGRARDFTPGPRKRPDPVSAAAFRIARFFAQPIVLSVALAALVAILVSFIGMSDLNGLVKLGMILCLGLAGAALILYRPVLFPLSAYIFMVPFDGMLQTGGGTINKFLGFLSAIVILFVLMNRRRTLTPPLAVVLWGVFVAWSVASYMWSAVPFFHSEYLAATAELYGMYLIFSMLRLRIAELNVFLGAALAGGVGLAGFGTWMFIHGTMVSSGAASSRLALALSNTSGIDADHFAATLVLPIALALVGTLHYRGWKKGVFAAALLVILSAMLVSGTRGTLIAVIGMGVYIAVFHGYRKQLGAVALGGLLCTIPLPNIWQRFTDPSQGEAGGRYGIWRIAWDAFKHHWLAGIGSNQFRIAYSESYLRIAKGALVHPWMEDSHNILASTGVELGVIGLIILFAAWFYQLRAVRGIPRSSALFPARVAIEAATVGLFINALSLDFMWFKYVWIAFSIGLLVRNAGIAEREKTYQKHGAPSVAA